MNLKDNLDRNLLIYLFDVNGTLTKPGEKITSKVEDFLMQIKSCCKVGLVSESDISKIKEQMGAKVIYKYDYVFAENGIVAYKDGDLIQNQSIFEHMGEEKLQMLINFCLEYMSKLTLPVKRGNFIEIRNSLIKVCPVGRSCSREERDEFEKYDRIHGIRKEFVEALKKEFADTGFVFSIGGQTSLNVFPKGWNKTYCLDQLYKDGIRRIHFFGDKTMEGGSDHALYADRRINGHTVHGPEDTIKILKNFIQIEHNIFRNFR